MFNNGKRNGLRNYVGAFVHVICAFLFEIKQVGKVCKIFLKIFLIMCARDWFFSTMANCLQLNLSIFLRSVRLRFHCGFVFLSFESQGGDAVVFCNICLVLLQFWRQFSTMRRRSMWAHSRVGSTRKVRRRNERGHFKWPMLQRGHHRKWNSTSSQGGMCLQFGWIWQPGDWSSRTCWEVGWSFVLVATALSQLKFLWCLQFRETKKSWRQGIEKSYCIHAWIFAALKNPRVHVHT